MVRGCGHRDGGAFKGFARCYAEEDKSGGMMFEMGKGREVCQEVLSVWLVAFRWVGCEALDYHFSFFLLLYSSGRNLSGFAVGLFTSFWSKGEDGAWVPF